MKAILRTARVLGIALLATGCGRSSEEGRFQTSIEFEHRELKKAEKKVESLEAELRVLREAQNRNDVRLEVMGQDIAKLAAQNRELARELAEARSAAAERPPEPASPPASEAVQGVNAEPGPNTRQIIAWKAAKIPEIEAAAFDARIQVVQAMESGAIARGSTSQDVLRTERVKSAYQNPLESGTRYETRVLTETESQPLPDLIYIYGLADVADNETRDVRLYPAGVQTQNLSGQVKRLKRYALDAETAADLIVDQ